MINRHRLSLYVHVLSFHRSAAYCVLLPVAMYTKTTVVVWLECCFVCMLCVWCSSLRLLIEKPPIGGKELLPLSQAQLSGFRLHPGQVSIKTHTHNSHTQIMHTSFRFHTPSLNYITPLQTARATSSYSRNDKNQVFYALWDFVKSVYVYKRPGW